MSKKLLVEGWRFLPHSYSAVNQWQCLAFKTHNDLELYHRDLPFCAAHWQAEHGLFAPEEEQAIATIPTPPPDLCPDAVLRLGFPYDFTPHQTAPTFVFGTSEFGTLFPNMISPRTPIARAVTEKRLTVITPSQWSKKGFVHSGFPEEQVKVIPHGVATHIFRPLPPPLRQNLRQAFGWEDKFIFLHIGAMTLNKGIGYAMKAFASVAAEFPQARMVLKGLDKLYQSRDGMGTMLREHLSKAEMQLISDKIIYFGEVMSFREIAALHQAADVYLSPYQAEGFNLPVLEAAACGIPVICTAGGSTDDFVTDDFAWRIPSTIGPHINSTGNQGFKLTPSLADLTALMRQAVTDSERREKVRRSGPEHVRRHYTWQKVSDQLLGVMGLLENQ